MRRITVHLQSTLDNRIANDQGTFWQPFPWGDPEMAYINQFFRSADTFALSRVMYEAIIPWWDGVATGQLPADDRVVIGGDLASQLANLKQQDGADVILACGPATLGPLASTPRLVNEYLVVVHPAVLAAGPRMFDHLTRDLAWSGCTPRCSRPAASSSATGCAGTERQRSRPTTTNGGISTGPAGEPLVLPHPGLADSRAFEGYVVVHPGS